MTPTILIRKATAQDASALRELRLEALLNRPEAFGGDYEREKQHTVEYWEEKLSEQVNDQIFVAVVDDHLVGMMGIDHPHSSKIRHNGTIWGVYMQPAWRGKGISNQLIEACMEWAREHEIKLVRLGVATTNQSAINSYVRSGFRVYGLDPQVILHDGVYYDELLMVREV